MEKAPETRLAKHEIRAWTVDGTPKAEMVAGLRDAYQGRDECEKQAFVDALIELVTSIQKS